MKLTIKSLIHYLQSPNFSHKHSSNLSSKYLISQTLIRASYAIIFFLSVENLEHWDFYLAKTKIDPIWPVSWLHFVNLYWGTTVIIWFNLIGGFLAITFSQYRFVRFIVFLSLLEFYGFKNSFGKISHGSHLVIFISFLFIFLPQGWHLVNSNKKLIKTSVLTIFSACQVLIMLTYTMSGVGKILYVFVQASRGEVHALMPKGLALTVANRLVETESTSYFGGWLIEHYHFAWILMIGAIYLQFFALWAAFRPPLHQIWGLGLILFHISVSLTMTITFEQNCLWLALFFLYSPFRPSSCSIKQIILNLPCIDWLIARTKQFFIISSKTKI